MFLKHSFSKDFVFPHLKILFTISTLGLKPIFLLIVDNFHPISTKKKLKPLFEFNSVNTLFFNFQNIFLKLIHFKNPILSMNDVKKHLKLLTFTVLPVTMNYVNTLMRKSFTIAPNSSMIFWTNLAYYFLLKMMKHGSSQPSIPCFFTKTRNMLPHLTNPFLLKLWPN